MFKACIDKFQLLSPRQLFDKKSHSYTGGQKWRASYQANTKFLPHTQNKNIPSARNYCLPFITAKYMPSAPFGKPIIMETDGNSTYISFGES